MPFSFDTKPNLNNRKFEQLSSECLNFSGTTSIFGSLCVIPTGIIDSFSGYKLSGYTFLDSSHICISSVFVGANSGANNRGYNEIAIGYNSLYNSCGNSNIAVGCNSLCSNTTGVGNIGIGVNTLLSSVSNSYNIAIGDNSLCTNNGGIYNIGLGYNTLKSNTIGCNNIGIGLEALKSNIGGKFNIGLGYKVLTNNTCGENNVGVGDSVLYCNISGNTNVGVGVNVLYNNKGGCSNTGIGNNVLYLNTFGQANTSIGYNSLSSNTIGCYNNAFGCGTLKSNISGCYNIGFGDRALYANTCGCLNIAMGSNALSGNTLGVSNIGIGNNSLQKNLTGNYNLGIGENVLCNNTSGCHNMGFGYYTLLNNTTGCNNVGIGYNILRTNTTGCNNLGLGYNVLYNNTTGCNNIALGFCTLCCNTIGLNNIGIGYGSLKTNTDGCGNISIGCFNLYNNVSGSNNVSIGTCAGYAETGSNKFYVANNATCNLIYGEFDNNIITLPKLKLCETPTTGAGTDSLLVWNSTDKCVKKIANNTIIGGLVTGATSSTDNAIARFDGITGKLIQNSGIVIDDNGNMGFGITPTAQITQTSTAALESAPLGAELLTSSNWTTTDWTGDFINGFTHTTGNVTPLTNTLAALNATLYQITYTITNRTAGSINITFGGVATGTVSSSGAIGNRTASTGTLSIVPTSDFNGTIVISIKRITGTYAPSYQILDSAGISTLEIRSSLNSLNNTFIGKGAGRYNTTGSNNSAQGVYALRSNTTGSYNSAQGFYALYSNTTGSNNSAQGFYALYSNTTGSNNSAQGVYALRSNTTGSNNSAQGFYALYSNTTGSNNSAQGVYALRSNTTGSNNSAQGFYALYSNTTGSNNSAQGVYAGRYLADGVTANQTSNNSVFLGANTKSKQEGQTNEIVIGANAIGNGSNTATIGHTDVTDTYLRGNIHLETTPLSGNTSDGVLVWNSTDKMVKLVSNSVIIGGTISNANNGLTKSGSNVRLGGVLTGNTAITGAYAMGFSNSYLNLTGSTCVNISGPTKLLSTPSSGLVTDSFLVWNSIDKTVKRINPSGVTSGLTSTYLKLDQSIPQTIVGTLQQKSEAQHEVTTVGTKPALQTIYYNNGAVANEVRFGGIMSCNLFFGKSSGCVVTTGVNNLSFGYLNLRFLTTGCGNIAIGSCVLNSNCVGCTNIGIGNATLALNTTGCGNVGIGSSALNLNSTGCDNTVIGDNALSTNTLGCNNIAVGRFAGRYIANGSSSNCLSNNSVYLGYNTKSLTNSDTNEIVIGYNAIGEGSNSIVLGNTNILNSYLRGNVILSTTPSTGSVGDSYLVWNSTDKCIKSVSCGSIISGATITANNGLNKIGQNVRLGGALTGNTTITGAYTLSLCSGALLNTQCGYQISGNTVLITKNGNGIYLGIDSGTNSTSSSSNSIGIGWCSLKASIGGCSNIGIGYRAIASNCNGSHNIGIGHQTLASNISGYDNIAMGNDSLVMNINGCNNIGIGGDSLSHVIAGSNNIGIGVGSLQYTCIGGNIAIGSYSLNNNFSGFDNIGIGCSTLYYNETGTNNIAIGSCSLFCTNANGNTGVGDTTLRSNTLGAYNTSLGFASLLYNQTGCNNVAIGQQTLRNNLIGSNNVAIGSCAGYNETGSNKFYVANNATCNLIYGDFTGNTVTLPKLKLCETPATGTGIDSILVWNSTDKCVKVVTNTAEANTASNLGTGCGIYSSKLGVDLRFKSLKAGNNISMSSDANEITICSTGSGGISTANNGLTKSGSNVRLGGTLTGNTSIIGGYTLSICNTSLNVNSPYMYNCTPILSYYGSYSISLGNNNGNQGSNSVSIGNNILCSDIGYNNIGIGNDIGNNITDSQYNLFIGNNIADAITEGTENIGIGFNIYGKVTSPSYCNILIGSNIFDSNSCTLLNNIMIGRNIALSSNEDYCNNIMIGDYAGSAANGNDNVFIGNYAGCGNQDSNRLYIANNGACVLIYGEFDNNIVRLPYLKLCNAPSTGVDTDQLLTWNSTDCCVKSINNTFFSSLWKSINASRASNTTITVDTGANDGTIIFTKGLIIKWTDGGVTKCGMVVSSTYSNPITKVTIIGDVCSATAYSFSYSLLPVEIIRFALAGNIGVTGTDVANAYYANYPLRVIGADIQVGTIGTPSSTNTTVDINKGGTTMFTVKPTLTSSATVTTPFTADNSVSLALNDKVTIDIDAVQTTAAVDLYVQLYVVQIRLLNMI